MPEFLNEYGPKIIFGLIAVVVLFGEKIKTWVGSVKLPALSGFWGSKSKNTKATEDVEAKDIECISHLRDRAVEYKDEVLLQEIKSVSNKFFDIHSHSNVDTK